MLCFIVCRLLWPFVLFKAYSCPQIGKFDISCQVGTIDVAVPDATVLGGNDFAASINAPVLRSMTSSSRAGVDYDLTAVSPALRPRLNSVTAQTTSGSIDMTHVLFGQYGAVLKSDSGDLMLNHVDGSCDPNQLGDSSGGVRLTTNLGGNVLL